MLAITASAMIPSLRPATCKDTSCPTATEFQYAVFFIALYLVAVGTGGVKSALMPFGADQYDEANPDEAQKKQSFFSLFFVAINLGVFIAGTVVVWIQQNIAWALGFGISLACLVVAALGFFLGTPIYRDQVPTGSPLKSVMRVSIVAFKKRHLELPKDNALLYEGDMGQEMDGQYKLEHTDGFRYFLSY
jgi:solute carrier family 15 (peptide/histidine transporter), member 3/4